MRHLERVPDPTEAEGYAFILPQVGTFATTNPDLVFSYVSVDRAGSALITGEYRQGQTGGRIVRWPLDLATGLVKAGTASAAFTSPATNVQGALELNGRLGTSSSAGAGNGTLTSGTPGQAAAGHPWAVGGGGSVVRAHERAGVLADGASGRPRRVRRSGLLGRALGAAAPLVCRSDRPRGRGTGHRRGGRSAARSGRHAHAR